MGHSSAALPISGNPLTLLVGNPNVGKSVIFGLLTGRYADVSNYPGTTVELARGRRRGRQGEVLDLPGTNTLTPNSEDERVTRDIILRHLNEDDLFVTQVCDTKNLRRGMFLTLQLAELGIPQVLVANMADEAADRGYSFDSKALESLLGVPVMEAVATRRQGLAPLLSGIAEPRPARLRINYGPAIEQAVTRIEALYPSSIRGRRGLALMLMAGSNALPEDAPLPPPERMGELAAIRAEVERALPQGLGSVIERARMAEAERITAEVLHREPAGRRKILDHLGDWALHPILGWPLAGAVLYGLYLFVGVLGAGTMVDLLETKLFGAIVTPWLDTALRAVLPATWAAPLIGPEGVAPGSGPGLLLGDYGLVSMGLTYAFAIVLPIVGFFFIAFSLLEDSGYLPRLAALLNSAFKLMGLNGKAVLPMVLGLGCDTMATMTTRILPSPKERIVVTLLLALGVPCSAQLGVILGLLAALSPAALMWWIGTVAGTMLLVGFLASRVLPGDSSALVLELPPMRIPQWGNILVKTVARVEWYLREVVPLFILGTFVLWGLDRLNVLVVLERWTAPVVQGFLGLPAKATQAFLIGFLRRDYGAAGLYDLFKDAIAAPGPSLETEIQVVVSLVTLTLFVPCIANFFMIAKEQGMKIALAMAGFIFPFAFLVGGILNWTLRWILL